MKYIKFIEFFILIFTISLSFYLLFNDLPFQTLPQNYSEIISFFRVSYFSLFCVYIYTAKNASILLYGSYYKQFEYYRICLILISFLLILGIFTFPLAILHFLLTLYVFRLNRSTYYGIEQVYHQIVGLFFIFSNSSLNYSIDKYLNITYFNNDFYSSIPANFLVISISLCLFSGAYEKLKIKTWRSGMAIFYFLNSPHLRRNNFYQILKNSKFLYKLFNYIALINQFFLIISLNFYFPRLFFYTGELFFAVCLIVFSAFHFIAETFILIFIFFIAIEINQNFDQLLLNIENFETVRFFYFFIILLSIFSLFARNFKFFNKLNIINRYLSGATPFKVYTDIHFFGIRVFQIKSYNKNNKFLGNTFEVFNNDGTIGRLQKWSPTFFISATYRLTNICERKVKNLYNKDDIIVIKNILNTSLKYGNKPKDTLFLELNIKTINPPSDYNFNLKDWIDKDWTAIARLNIQTHKIDYWINDPTPSIKCERNFETSN